MISSYFIREVIITCSAVHETCISSVNTCLGRSILQSSHLKWTEQVNTAEKTVNVKIQRRLKTEETTESQPLQIPLDGDIPISTEEFLDYNKGSHLTIMV